MARTVEVFFLSSSPIASVVMQSAGLNRVENCELRPNCGFPFSPRSPRGLHGLIH